jgi:hypothetical protein
MLHLDESIHRACSLGRVLSCHSAKNNLSNFVRFGWQEMDALGVNEVSVRGFSGPWSPPEAREALPDELAGATRKITFAVGLPSRLKPSIISCRDHSGNVGKICGHQKED